jgi:exosortase
MSVIATQEPAQHVQPEPLKEEPFPTLFWICVLLGLIPLVLLHLRGLWYQPSYQAFPFVLAGFAWFLYSRWPRKEALSVRARPRLARLTILASIFLLSAAVVIWSPLVAMVASILAVGALFLGLGRRAPDARLLPVWLLLWLCVPLPFDLDTRVMSWMQRHTAATTSDMLDYLNVYHFSQGTIIEFPSKQLLVDEGCCGINSLFALVICAALYALWRRRPPVHAVLLLLAAVFWAGMGNLVRVFSIALVYDSFGVDLSTGWRHEVLGLVIFAIAAAVLASTDQLLRFILRPIKAPRSSKKRFRLSKYWKGQRPYRYSRMWNRWLAGEPDKRHLRGMPEDNQSTNESLRWQTLGQAWQLRGLALVCIVLGTLQMVVLGATLLDRAKGPPSEAHVELEMAAIDESTLPGNAGQWQRKDFQTTERPKLSPLGRFSRIWQYQAPKYAVLVSLDYPFLRSHQLTICYGGLGWELVREEIGEEPMRGVAGAPKWQMREAEMTKSIGQHAFLLYSHFDDAGHPVEQYVPVTTYTGKVLERLGRAPLWKLLTTGRARGLVSWTTFQTQVFAVSDHRLTPAEQQEVRSRYLEFREMLRRATTQRTEIQP